MRNLVFSGALPLLTCAFFLTGCGEADPATTSTGGSGGTGGTGGAAAETPDYAKAFPQSEVGRIDITITAENWNAMVADMTDMLGDFGTGSVGPGSGGNTPSAESITACNGLSPGDACSFNVNGMPIMGTCADMMGTTSCQTDPGGGMQLPPELTTPCIGLAAGDMCSANFLGMQYNSQCADFGGTLVCPPPGGPGGGGPGGGGSSDLIPRTPIYAECDVQTADRTWNHVGIRFKGNSSLAMSWMQGVWKMPLRLNFDKFEDTYPEIKNQRFYGFEGLSLSNGANDTSFLRDKIGTEVFAHAGIPAPATAFYRIYIDHGEGSKYFGLYTGIELPEDEAFLDQNFGGHKGNVYKPDGVGATWKTFDTETLGKENNEDAADYSDAQGLFDALHADRSDAAAWRTNLEKHLDVDSFLHWLALNAVVQDWDQYGRMSHNYYLYSDPNANGAFTWIPWDHSFAFPGSSGGLGSQQAMSLGMTEITDDWPLIRYLLDDPVYLETYRTYLAQAAATEYDAATMEKRFQEAHDLIAPYVTGEFGEAPGYTFLTSPAAFDAGLTEVITHAKGRKAEVDAFLGP